MRAFTIPYYNSILIRIASFIFCRNLFPPNIIEATIFQVSLNIFISPLFFVVVVLLPNKLYARMKWGVRIKVTAL